MTSFVAAVHFLFEVIQLLETKREKKNIQTEVTKDIKMMKRKTIEEKYERVLVVTQGCWSLNTRELT